MLSRATLIAGLGAVLLVPAAASARDHSRAAEKLNDPLVQTQAAAMAMVMSQMLLDLNVGPMARALGEWTPEARDIPDDARLGDLLGPEARALPRELGREVPRTMGKLGRSADAVDAMLPQIEAMADKMRRAMDQAGLGH